MAKHRIFVAINLPSDVKKELVFYQKKWENLPVRWTKEDNLHLTLVFIGYIENEGLLEIFGKTKEVAKRYQPFEINFLRICLGPPDKPPRMFWVEGEKSKELAFLSNDLGREFSVLKAKKEVREFKLHITLGRIRMLEWRQLQEKPKVEENISITVPVNSIEVMESQLQRGGAEYTVLESAPLG